MASRITLNLQHNFLNRFTQLIENGFSVSEALDVMAVILNPALIREFQDACLQGIAFATILETHGFEPRVVYMIRCNEENGSLLLGLQKARDYSTNHLKNRRELSKKLRYPLILLGIMLVVVSAVYLFFLPQLDSFYESFNIEGDTATLTGIILIMGSFLFLCALFAGTVLYVLRTSKDVSAIFKYRLAKRLFSYYFSSQWQMLLACGLPLKDSLHTLITFENTPLIRRAITQIKNELETGELLEDVIEKLPFFTEYFQMVMVHALKIGCVPFELAQFTKTELDYFNHLLGQLFKGIQTGFLVLIASMIIMLYLSILQPVFEMVHIL